MNTRNLIPTNRLALKRRANAIQRWSIANAAYLALLAVTAGCLLAFTGPRDPVAEAAGMKAELSQSNHTLASLRQQSLALRACLQSAREMSLTPDWSILLHALSGSLPEDVVLNRIDSTDDPKFAAARRTVPRVIRVSGIGRSQQSVTRFVLKLEELDFFSRVRIVQTSPQVLRGYDSVGFDLECLLTSNREGQP